MIIKGARIAAFIGRPDPAVLVALLYGPDLGLVRERGDLLLRAVARDPRDPFVVAEIAADRLKKDPSLLADEVASLSPTRERRVIRIRDAGDEAAAAVAATLAADGGALVILEAGDLGKKSPLRGMVENAANAAAIPCYADEGSGLQDFVRDTLGQAGIALDGDALAFLAASLGNDRLANRGELEKLILYAGGVRRLTLADVTACVGDGSVASLDALAGAVAGGDLAAVDTALERVWSEGQAPVSVVRAVSRHFLRLHLAIGLVSAGASPDQAVAALRPPLFFKHKDSFLREMSRWYRDGLSEALHQLDQAEIDCKTSGVPAPEACGRALLRLASAARRSAAARRRT